MRGVNSELKNRKNKVPEKWHCCFIQANNKIIFCVDYDMKYGDYAEVAFLCKRVVELNPNFKIKKTVIKREGLA